MSELGNLLSYLKFSKNSLKKRLALAIFRYSDDKISVKIAHTVLDERVSIDLWELKSLIVPSEFSFPEPDIGLVGVIDEDLQ